jgi:molybdopterin synthase catalytic subunit
MVTSLTLTYEKVDVSRLAAGCPPSAECGAVITFVGVVRAIEAGESVAGLEYESFRQMAEHQFKLLFQGMEKRWPVASVNVVHRLGVIPAGEPSLWVRVSAPHRQEAFAACEWLIDEMKKVVPIWKKPFKGSLT